MSCWAARLTAGARSLYPLLAGAAAVVMNGWKRLAVGCRAVRVVASGGTAKYKEESNQQGESNDRADRVIPGGGRPPRLREATVTPLMMQELAE